jgi:hypothetical protein
LDGFEVHNGSLLTPANANNWVLDGSASSDTLDDIQTLQYVWYIDGDARLSGKSIFTQADYSFSGHKEVKLVVTDDDGAESQINFTVFVEEETITGNNSLTVIAIIGFTALILGLLVMRKMSTRFRGSASSRDIPKWGGAKNVDSEQNDESADTID